MRRPTKSQPTKALGRISPSARQAIADAPTGGFMYRPSPGDDTQAIAESLVAGIKESSRQFDERYGIVRSDSGEILSRMPIEEVIRTKGPRPAPSMYQLASFVSYQASKRVSDIRADLRQVSADLTTAADWPIDGPLKERALEIVRACHALVSAASESAYAIWHADVERFNAAGPDERAWLQALDQHGEVVDLWQHSKDVARVASSALAELQASAAARGRIQPL